MPLEKGADLPGAGLISSDSIFKKALVVADGALLRLYTALKSRTKLSDRTMDRILKYL